MNDHDDASHPQPEPVTNLLLFQDFEGIIENGEFLVRDTALAQKLGFDRPRKIRELIERHMAELEQYGLVPHRGAPYVSGKGRVSETTEYYLNRKHALTLVRRSDAQNADRIYALMMAVFDNFADEFAELNGDQLAERIAFLESRFALAYTGAVIHARKAAYLEGEAARLRAEAEHCRSRRGDLLAVREAARQLAARAIAEERDPRVRQLLTAPIFGRQLMALSPDALVMWVLLEEMPHPVALVDLLDRIERACGRTLSPSAARQSLERLEQMGQVRLLRKELPKPSAGRLQGQSLPPIEEAVAWPANHEADAILLLDALDGPNAVFEGANAHYGAPLDPAAATLVMDERPSHSNLPPAIRFVRAIFGLAADHRVWFRDGFVALNALARDNRLELHQPTAVGKPRLASPERATGRVLHPRQIYRLLAPKTESTCTAQIIADGQEDSGAPVHLDDRIALQPLLALGLIEERSSRYLIKPQPAMIAAPVVPEQEAILIDAAAVETEENDAASRPEKLMDCIVVALQGHPAGLAGNQICAAASKVAGRELKRTSVVPLVTRAKNRGRVECRDGLWFATDHPLNQTGSADKLH